MLLQYRQCLLRKCFQIWVGSVVGLVLKCLNVGLMIVHHVVDVFLIEISSDKVTEAIGGRLMA